MVADPCAGGAVERGGQLPNPKIQTLSADVAQAALSSGAVIVTIKSAEVHKDILVEAVAKLTAKGLSHEHEFNPALVPAGHVLVLPGNYVLEVIYPGDTSYAAATATIPLAIAPGCGLADLFI